MTSVLLRRIRHRLACSAHHGIRHRSASPRKQLRCAGSRRHPRRPIASTLHRNRRPRPRPHDSHCGGPSALARRRRPCLSRHNFPGRGHRLSGCLQSRLHRFGAHAFERPLPDASVAFPPDDGARRHASHRIPFEVRIDHLHSSRRTRLAGLRTRRLPGCEKPPRLRLDDARPGPGTAPLATHPHASAPAPPPAAAAAVSHLHPRLHRLRKPTSAPLVSASRSRSHRGAACCSSSTTPLCWLNPTGCISPLCCSSLSYCCLNSSLMRPRRNALPQQTRYTHHARARNRRGTDLRAGSHQATRSTRLGHQVRPQDLRPGQG